MLLEVDPIQRRMHPIKTPKNPTLFIIMHYPLISIYLNQYFFVFLRKNDNKIEKKSVRVSL